MFDPETTDLLQGAPTLRGLEGRDLGAELTRAYSWLAAFRLRITGQVTSQGGRSGDGRDDSPLAAGWAEEATRLRRLSATYEAFALVRADGSEDRAAAAFVAATANQLLSRAAGLRLFPERPSGTVAPDYLSPDFSAMLLYFVAGYPADAQEIANALPLPAGQEASRSLERALILFGRGAFGEMQPPRPRVPGFADALLPDHAAAEVLFLRLADVIHRIARLLAGAGDDTSESIRAALAEIEALCVEQASDDLSARLHDIRTGTRTGGRQPVVISSFGGPYHLARLLSAASDTLIQMSVAKLPPPPGTDQDTWYRYRQNLAPRRPFLWPNHREAVDQGYLAAGTSSVITFPTGAGKSTLAELKIAATLGAGRHVIYLAPTHALAGQVTRELEVALHHTFPLVRVVQSLAAESEYSEVDAQQPADIAVMTPERCLTLLGVAPDSFQSVGAVIFDECHLIHGSDRDTDRRALDAMLCLLGLFEQCRDADFVLLSAMIENAPELASWLSWAIGRRCLPLSLNWKPTRQARSCVLFRKADVDAATRMLSLAYQVNRDSRKPTKAPPRALHSIIRAVPHALFGLTNNWSEAITDEQYTLLPLLEEPVSLVGSSWQRLDDAADNVTAALVQRLAALNQRTIVFLQQRRSCASTVSRLEELLKAASVPGPELDVEEVNLLSATVEDLGSVSAALISPGTRVDQHHGLMLYAERRFAERRFEKRDGTRVLVATGTLAQGMNLPADSVVIVGTKRYEGADDDDERPGGWESVGPEELLNAAGRAGRAGRAAAGLAFIVPDALVSVDDSGRGNSEWRRLQSTFLSKSDQCLVVEDPVERLLDRLQGASDIPARNVRYFLNRLPLAAGDDQPAEASVRLLRRSLSRFRAVSEGREDAFAERLRVIPVAQRRLNLLMEERPDLAWLDAAAWRLGVPVLCLRSLHNALQQDLLADDSTVLDWLAWLFRWLASDPVSTMEIIRPGGLKLALAPHELEEWHPEIPGQLRGILPTVEKRVRAWMTAVPLLQIEGMLARIATAGDSAHRRPGSNKCENARKFVLRFMVDLSYAAGAVALVRRQQLEAETPFPGLLTPQPPLALAVLASCIREGVDSPGALAVRHVLGPGVSRVRVQRRFVDIQHLLSPGIYNRSYPELKDEIGRLLVSNIVE